MMNIEKAIKGLECIGTEGKCCSYDCPYWEVSNCINAVSSDAINLLKEQEKEISRISNEYLKLAKEASKMPRIVRREDCKHRPTEYAIYENTVLLYEQIKEIRKTLDLLILKLERRAENER